MINLRRNEMGFTVLELVIVICILAMIGFAVVGAKKAEGSMLIHTLMGTDDASIANIAAVVDSSELTQVVILTYAKTWTHDSVDDLVDKSRSVQRKLVNAGIPLKNILLSFANASGLSEDKNIDRIPEKDGVYLYIQ